MNVTKDTTFPSLAARVLNAYVAAYPVFKAADGVDEASQRDFHAFMKDALTDMYQRPSIIGADETVPDDCYHGGQLNNTKPALIAAMEKVESKFASFIESLMTLGKCGQAVGQTLVIDKTAKTVGASLCEKLAAVGIDVSREKTRAVLSCPAHPALFPAFCAYARCDDEAATKISRVMRFVHARYFGRVYNVSDFFGALLPNRSAADALEAFFSARGYQLYNEDINNKTRYAYVKWLKEYPKGETGSLRVSYNWRKDEPLIFEFRVPGFRALLADFDVWDDALKRFVLSHLKTCDGCGYCNQTDKTGKRPRLTMQLTCDGKASGKCPLYPWFVWNDMQESDLAHMRTLFDMAEKAIQPK